MRVANIYRMWFISVGQTASCRAKKKPVDIKKAADLGITADVKAKVVKVVPPPARPPGKIIEGEEPAQKAATLVKLLREEAKVI